MSFIKKIAVANRGEIARRIISTCHQMNLKTVLLYASGDTYQEAFRIADEAICIGPADVTLSYLNPSAQVEAALGAGADALHPGYGFLSENSEFARLCEQKGIKFIGPSSETISLFADKIKARELCEQKGVPVLPGFTGSKESDIIKAAEKIGFPVILKASRGGGGRGLRKAYSIEELKSFIPIVRSEAKKSFNDDKIFLEKYLESAKHIEVQVFVDATKRVYVLGDRNCSLQRRHQKIIEEAPAQIPEKVKQRMKDVVFSLCKSLDYEGAGTMEFLLQDDNFYFLEMNTRLQVEHTVTEMILGLDIVRAQILTAMGKPAFSADQNFTPQGHSIQCRICVEDPFNEFLPQTGKLISCRWPTGLGCRVDYGFNEGDKISPFYDSLIAKIITWDNYRSRSIEKMKESLKSTVIFGCRTNIPFLQHMLSHNTFIEDNIHIDFIEKNYASGLDKEVLPFDVDFMQYIYKQVGDNTSSNTSSFNPWSDFLKRKK